MSRLPIRIRLTLPFAAAMALVLAALGGFVYLRVGSNLLNSTDQTLFAKATEATLRLGRGQAPLDRNPGARVGLAQVLARGGGVAESQPPGLAPLLSAAELRTVFSGRSVRATVDVPGRSGRWRLLAIPVGSADEQHALVLASSLDVREESLERLRRELLVGSPLALLLATLAGYVLAGAALRPVEEMRRKAGAISASTPGSRLPVPPARDEISRLAETLNDMLQRLETAFEHERRFVADASHELRTPLALLRTELELALRHPRSREELEDALRSAVEETDRLTSLAADLLLIARADQGQLPVHPEPTAAHGLLDAAGARFAARADELGRDITIIRGDDALVDADARRVEQALGNLVDNALVHGRGDGHASRRSRSPTGSSCTCATRAPASRAGFAARAFDRFSRADEARPRPGSGLGLAIVQTIAQAHGGSAGVSQTPGDADVWISLPLARGAIRQLPEAVAPYLRS